MLFPEIWQDLLASWLFPRGGVGCGCPQPIPAYGRVRSQAGVEDWKAEMVPGAGVPLAGAAPEAQGVPGSAPRALAPAVSQTRAKRASSAPGLVTASLLT